MSKITHYLKEVEQTHKSGIAREHAYRGFLQNLLHQILPEEIRATNEPARISCGSPDYVLTKKNIPVGYIEAKDLGVDLADKKHQEQLDRYRFSLPNFIFTNYLDFHFYRDGNFVTAISIAKITPENLVAISENFEQFESLLKSFATHISQSIKSPKSLAGMMAKKAKLLALIIENALNSDEENQQNSSLKEQMDAFKEILIHNIKPKEFADIYAQTIAYGMFAARLHDQSLNTFSRQEAADLIPKTNPFLRKLFQYVAGYDLDSRISWIVDDLAEIFRATDIAALLENFGKATKRQDPIIHFYETFLSEYDPALRKSRGVWYTPQPVVNFIVRATDEILKSEFGLKDGLADTTKIKKKIDTHLPDKRMVGGYKQDEVEFHKVQILDPATGTGTFLTEVIKQIHQKFAGQQGIWSRYVDDHLIPRLNGFELLMASYAMAHLKLDLLLTETGYKPVQEANKRDQRFKIFLTNSLEEANPDQNVPLLAFMRELTIEGLEASKVKNETPVMVILGNPPYSGESQNKSDWIMKLMEDYKKEPSSNEKLKEKNPKWINDDYVKFLRFGQYFIEKNGEGILALINPHGFLDNPTFRSVRFSLLQAYDKIYAIDLHGNAKKKESALDGSKDENVFDIQQGVSINIFVKNGKKKAGELAQVFHFDCFGKREDKYNFLWENSLSSIAFKTLPNQAPMYFMVQKDFELKKEYEEGFSVAELFPVNSVGIVTARDAVLVNDKKSDLLKNVAEFYQINADESLVQKIAYRPFDEKFIYYDLNLVERARAKVMQHFLAGENLGLTLCKQFKTGDSYFHSFVTNQIIESSLVSNRTSEITSLFPLYLYNQQPESADLLKHSKPTRTPNLNPKILKEISANLGLTFAPDHKLDGITLPLREGQTSEASLGRGQSLEVAQDSDFAENTQPLLGSLRSPILPQGEDNGAEGCFSPLDLLDYIYAVLHSPNYREKYKEFLKIDFPRVPYPSNQNIFWQLVKLGGSLRKIHLLEGEISEKLITTYPCDGDNKVEKISYEKGKVRINPTQYFEGVEPDVWEFFIGGYQPAQKWLKDRKGKILNFEEILYYQKIIAALSQTDRLMKEIAKINLTSF
jgi:predicted helicase